jgi:hypothetical protein
MDGRGASTRPFHFFVLVLALGFVFGLVFAFGGVFGGVFGVAFAPFIDILTLVTTGV